MFPNLIAQTYTIQELQGRLQFLKQYLKMQLFVQEPSGLQSNTNKFSSEDLVWLETLPADFLKGITRENLEQTFMDFENQIKAIKPLVIMVPTELPKNMVSEITNKLRSDYGPNFFIDVEIDPSLIAGCALVWNGNLRDYSIKKRIEDMKPDILAIFKTWK